MKRCDVVIVGAGPVGLCTAALIAGSPAGARARIRVLDVGEPASWDPARTDLRVYALSAASADLLQQAGALARIAAARMSPYERLHVWEGMTAASAGHLVFDSADIGAADLGHIVEDNLLRVALHAAVAAHDNVEIRFRSPIARLEITPQHARLELADGSTLQCSVVIGADGARSQIRDAARLSGFERDYGQQGLVAHVVTERPHRRTAWQRFLPGGPLALLPLADGRCSIVWSLPHKLAGELLALPPRRFEQRLGSASGHVLGALQLDSERLALPLFARHAQRYCRARVALVGDAAHSVHPLAGQGVNLGLADAAELAGQLGAAIAAGQDPGDLRVLQRYERARSGANLLMLGALDALDRLFRAPRVLAPLRAAGLSCVNRLPLLRRQLIRHAVGESRGGL